MDTVKQTLSEKHYVRVALLNRRGFSLDYKVEPAQAPPPPWRGKRVLCDLQGRLTLAMVVEELSESPLAAEKIKPILAWVEEELALPEAFWKKAKWVCDYYGADLASVLTLCLPKWFGRLSQARGKFKLRSFRSPSLGPGSEFIELHYLRSGGFESEAKKILNFRVLPEALQSDLAPMSGDLELSALQKTALEGLLQEPRIKLLYGVTASGKTRVYGHFLRSIWEAKRLPSLVLVPEIALIPSMVSQLEAFGFQCASYHGLLTDQQKFQIWQRVLRGEIQVVCGTRSSIWLPFPSLGALIVDEEHDNSYKNQNHPREHVRDVACWLARNLSAEIILGSATPSLETLQNVQAGKFAQFSLTIAAATLKQSLSVRRNPFPPLEGRGANAQLGASYFEAIQHALYAGKHTLMMLNRRGFAEKILCKTCHQLLRCFECDHPYAFHAHQQQLRCTVCQAMRPIPRQCPRCQAQVWVELGLGTERVMKALESAFPDALICRCDQDTVADSSLLFERLKAFFSQKRPGILLGTQMISKGHDFKSIGLSILLGIDQAFFCNDLKAEERLCQMYTQVLGRVARQGGEGQIMVATQFTDHPLLQALERGGYMEAAQFLLRERQAHMAFPWSRWFQVGCEAKEGLWAEAELKQIKNDLKGILETPPFGSPFKEKCTLLGPYPASQPKRMGRYRWLLDVGTQESDRSQRLKLIRRTSQLTSARQDRRVKLWLDVDPQVLS